MLLASLRAVPVGAGGESEKAFGVVREETVIRNRWGDPMKPYLAFRLSAGRRRKDGTRWS